jgi:hypothetical protein
MAESDSYHISGCYHVANGLKLRIMDALIRNGNKPMTTRDFADSIGVPIINISNSMKHYMTFRRHYFRRLPKRVKGFGSGGGYRYTMTDYGIGIYLKYLKRVKLGVDLNLHKPTPVEMPHYDGLKKIDMKQAMQEGIKLEEIANYIKVSWVGATEMGFLDDDEALLKAAGLIRDD